MKLFFVVFWIFTFIIDGSTQELVRKTDSLIRSIESSMNLEAKGFCDTAFASHSDYFATFCMEYRLFESKLIRIVQKLNRFKISSFYEDQFGTSPMRTGVIGVDTFYFYYDTLIKATIADYDGPLVCVTYFYFTGNDLAQMEKEGRKGTDEYKRAESCIGLGYRRLDDFKSNK